jgi:IS5 family transposase
MFKTHTFIFNGACFLGIFKTYMFITADFFSNRLDQMIDLRRPLAVLSNSMPWLGIEDTLANLFARQVRAGKKIEDLDLFGATEVIAGSCVSNSSRPRLCSDRL